MQLLLLQHNSPVFSSVLNDSLAFKDSVKTNFSMVSTKSQNLNKELFKIRVIWIKKLPQISPLYGTEENSYYGLEIIAFAKNFSD
jgi:hypothetical protein